MFNKPSLTPRNDTITRKDVKNVLSTMSGVTEPQPKTASPAPAEAKPNEAATNLETPSENVMGARLIVGPDVKLKGAEILDCDTLVVEGRVEATMDSRVIRIADQGAFAGKVSIDVAEIHGTFDGELTARSQLIIHATGKVNGKIRYGKLVIDEGGELCGDISSISSDKPHFNKVPNEISLPVSGMVG
ncbi:MAG: polymer-forming cytoskeletal protein [Rhodocyclales bacterium GT-UBC]|nr:MAG: polymer-forming cytoskeletal protein [Rhodocyclales bacterium GT-UBC]